MVSSNLLMLYCEDEGNHLLTAQETCYLIRLSEPPGQLQSISNHVGNLRPWPSQSTKSRRPITVGDLPIVGCGKRVARRFVLDWCFEGKSVSCLKRSRPERLVWQSVARGSWWHCRFYPEDVEEHRRVPAKDLLIDLSLLDFDNIIADVEEIRRYNPQRFEMEHGSKTCF